MATRTATKTKTKTKTKTNATAKANAKAATKGKAGATKAKPAPAAKAKPAPAAKAKPAPATKKPAPSTTKAPVNRTKADLARATPEAAPRVHGPRADFGAPAGSFFAKQPAPIRVILEELRGLIESEVPAAVSVLKWGMPCYTLDGKPFVSLGAHKEHVNLVLWGSPETYADPDGLLSGDGKTGRRLVVRSLDELPRNAVRGWIEAAARRVRA